MHYVCMESESIRANVVAEYLSNTIYLDYFVYLKARQMDMNLVQIDLTNIKSKLKPKFFLGMKTLQTQFKQERRHSLT